MINSFKKDKYPNLSLVYSCPYKNIPFKETDSSLILCKSFIRNKLLDNNYSITGDNWYNLFSEGHYFLGWYLPTLINRKEIDQSKWKFIVHQNIEYGRDKESLLKRYSDNNIYDINSKENLKYNETLKQLQKEQTNKENEAIFFYYFEGEDHIVYIGMALYKRIEDE